MNHARVLIVDDEPFARQAFSECLRRKAFHVFEADSGQQALEKIRRDKPDIVISDMVMPGMDGLQLLKEARALRTDLPFLIISGYPSPNAAITAMKQGASDYLAKPFKPEELARRVNRSLLERRLDKPHESLKGLLLGATISIALWVVIISALSSFFP